MAIYDLVKDAHSGDEVLDGKGPALVMEEGEVGVLQSIHVEVERILAAIGLNTRAIALGVALEKYPQSGIPAPVPVDRDRRATRVVPLPPSPTTCRLPIDSRKGRARISLFSHRSQ